MLAYNLRRTVNSARRPQGLERTSQSPGARGRWPQRSHRSAIPASIRSSIPSVESQFCQQQRR